MSLRSGLGLGRTLGHTFNCIQSPKGRIFETFFLVIFRVFFCHKSAVTRTIQRTYTFLAKKPGKQAYFWEKINI